MVFCGDAVGVRVADVGVGGDAVGVRVAEVGVEGDAVGFCGDAFAAGAAEDRARADAVGFCGDAVAVGVAEDRARGDTFGRLVRSIPGLGEAVQKARLSQCNRRRFACVIASTSVCSECTSNAMTYGKRLTTALRMLNGAPEVPGQTGKDAGASL